jgi:hypothetical protein
MVRMKSLAAQICHYKYVFLCALCVLCGKSSSVASPLQVVPVEGAAFDAELVSIGADKDLTFHVVEKPEPMVLKLDALVRWGHTVPPRAQTLVTLTDGGRLVTAADWSGGAAVRLKGDDVVVRSDTWDEITLPKNLVSGIVFSQRSRADEREKLAEQIGKPPSPAPPQHDNEITTADAVLLINGDRLTGTLTSLEGGSLTLKAASGETKLPLSRVEAIAFGSRPSAAGSSASSAQANSIVVGMRDGSLVHAQGIEASSKSVTIKLADGVKLTGGKVDDIVALQSLGERIKYLSDFERADYRFVPYLSIEWPMGRDRNVLNSPLTVDGKRYLKGIGLHSAARVTYRLDREYQRFDATVAVDDAAKGRGSVVFSAYVEREGKWGEAYKSDTLRGGELPQAVSVDLRGAKSLTLTVDYADRGDELDYADWLDARIVR